MEHVIENQPLPLFFRQVFLENLSGRLTVTDKDFRITLDFVSGKLTNASSTRFNEKLLVILHLMGKLTEEQYNFSSGLQQFPDDQVGEMLLEHRFVKIKDLYYARVYQLRRIAVSLFSIFRGSWDFNDEALPTPALETIQLPLAGIIAEGARTIERISSFSSRWLFHVPRPGSEIPHHLDVYFTNDERQFLSRLRTQAQRTCRELIARIDLQPIDFWRKTLVFHLLGILEFEKIQTAADVTQDVADLLRLHQRIQQAKEDDFSLLGLSADASATAIENTQSQLLARFSPERFGSAAAPEIKRIARDVCQRLQQIRPQTPESEAVTLPGVEETVLKIGAEPIDATEMIIEPAEGALPLPEPPRTEAVVAGPATVASPHEKAWNLYLKGKELFEQRDLTKAIDAVRQAIKLEPDKGDFYFLLGMCLNETELTHGEAEINLKRAIELMPWSAEPVYALGLLFRSQKKMKMAERCFRRVKEIAAGHSGASQALVDLRRLRSGKKAKLSFLKKKSP